MVRRKLGALSILFCVAAWSSCAQQTGKKLNNDDIKEMVSLGLSDDLIVDKIRAASATEFDTSVEALKGLKAAKISDPVIRAMINPHPVPVAVNAPAKDSEANADPNDPNSPHSPGIYMYTKGKNGLQLTMIEPTVYTQGKSSGLFKSAVTYGIAKVKWKAVVQGTHANIKTSDPSAVFYFYGEESNGTAHGSFGGSTTPGEFTLLKFDQKKDVRETVVMQANAFGASSGTDEKANTGFVSTKLKPGIYRLVPDKPLTVGEYCFFTSTANAGPYGAGAATANRLFDFSVTPAE